MKFESADKIHKKSKDGSGLGIPDRFSMFLSSIGDWFMLRLVAPGLPDMVGRASAIHALAYNYFNSERSHYSRSNFKLSRAAVLVAAFMRNKDQFFCPGSDWLETA